MTILLTFLSIAGGVALILFGVRFLRKGLDRLFGPRLHHWIQRLAGRRLSAFFSGIGLGLITPSSTTISVLTVQTIQAGHANSRQMLGLMFGADIGMTVMVILLALRLEQYAPILIVAGLPFYQYTSAARTRGTGQVIMAIGFIFLGVSIIKLWTSGLPSADLTRLIDATGQYPVILTMLAALLAVCLQSSTATIALMIGLAAGKTIAFTTEAAMAVVIGANVGIALTTLMIAWPQVDSRRLALGNLSAKLDVAVIALIFMGPLSGLIEQTALPLPAQMAVMHSGFNVVLAAMGLPLVGVISWMTHLVIPDASRQQQPFGPRYIPNSPIDSVTLAMSLSRREILHAAEIVRSMFYDLWRALESNDHRLCQQVSKRDDQVDLLDMQIKRFLTRLASQGLDHNDAAEQLRQLRYLNELETIGDIIDKNLSELVTKKIRNQVTFSDEGACELNDFHGKVLENLVIAETVFSTQDRDLAVTLLSHKQAIDQTERTLRDEHFARLNAGLTETHETSAIHLDILTHLKRINTSLTHIAHAILQDTQSKD